MATFALVHGGGHDSYTWHRLIPELQNLGHQSVTVDLPADDPTVGLSGYIEVATQAFAHVPGPLIAVGHSNAGPTVLGLEKTLDLEGIVLLNATVALSPEVAPDQPVPMLDLDYSELTIDEQGLAHMSEEFCRRRFYQDLSEEMLADVLPHVRPQSMAGVAGPDAFPEPTVPVTYIHAEDDQMINRQWAEWAAARLTGRPLRLIPGSHSTFYSRPAELARLLDEIASEYITERHLATAAEK
jgi:pimeloyl-ACP methyl ester carboxylesterase